jgi:hypothetical protein
MGATAGYFAGRALESGVWGPLIGAAIGIGLAAIGREIVLKSARTIPVPKD